MWLARPVTERAPTLRQRVRAELVREITDAGRRQLAEVGASALSLRAVAREVGMVSSAVYRYFPSRDHLLTALIVEAHDSLGAAVEDAEAAVEWHDLPGRFRAVGRATRQWALAHPHEYGLLYGSPVPGYAAPADTIGPAIRVTSVLRSILFDARAGGRLTVPEGELVPAVSDDLARLADGIFPGLPLAVVVRGLMAWSQLFGTISFELFGHLHTVITDYDAWFEQVLTELVAFVGVR